jgi:hypothetical protein
MGKAALLIRNFDAVFPVKITSSHRIKCCRGPRASLDDLEKRKTFGSTTIRTPDCQERSLISMLTLYWILGITFSIPVS